MSIIQTVSTRQLWRSRLSIRTYQCVCHRTLTARSFSQTIQPFSIVSFHRSFGSVATHTVPEPAPHINMQPISQPTIQSTPSQQPNQTELSQPATSQFNQTIELTNAASARIAALKSKHGPNTALRLSIDSGGCSGMSYKFEIDTNGPEPDDKIFTNETDPQSKLLVDSFSLEHLAGSIIDYRSRIERSGFEVVANPNAAGKCGCGTSFQPKNF